MICSWIVGLVMVAPTHAVELAGLSVTPHVQSDAMKYRRPADGELGARVELFLRNDSPKPWSVDANTPVTWDGQTAAELLQTGDWTWHDTPGVAVTDTYTVPPEALTVWTFNAHHSRWGVETRHDLDIATAQGQRKLQLELRRPSCYLSAVTFLSGTGDVRPNEVVVHLANDQPEAVTIDAVRLWLPNDRQSFRVFKPGPWRSDLERFPQNGVVVGHERGGLIMATDPLPLGYGVGEGRLLDESQHPLSIWGHLRIKREVVDISGGWVAADVGGRNSLTLEPFLKTLRRMHLDTAHIGDVAGYTDNAELYARYPLKLFNRLQPTTRFESADILPRVHAVEFLGEPQYGGGRPVPPQEVWQALAPYRATQLPTTVTHSEERIWRDYAGLSDYPHYDAYRITAPAADAWSLYQRWRGEPLRWAAPLETIGDLTRSLRALNRPKPIAYWSQGAHSGWGRYGGRQRTSPTPAELKSQAYHAISSRITSLYWFNLSLDSLLKFPDLIGPITEVNRELRLLDEILLRGDAYRYHRVTDEAGNPQWDLASIAAPDRMACFALDLDYRADYDEQLLRFAPQREGRFDFLLPPWLAAPEEIFRVDAGGTYDVAAAVLDGKLMIRDTVHVAGIYLAGPAGMRQAIESELQQLLAFEESFAFDPAGNADDLQTLKDLRR